MPRRRNQIAWLALIWAGLFGPAEGLAQPSPGRKLHDASNWKLDRITLASGEVLHGLIESENDRSVQFLEIRRPQGRGTYGVSRPLEKSEIASLERLPGPQRQHSRQRFDEYRNRSRVEAGKMDELLLEAVVEAGQPRYRYRGDWFSLESTAPEEMTRRSIVRIEQVFAAYRQMMPERTTPERPLRILLLGSMTEYRAFLQAVRLPVENPAFFAADWNMVVAGSDQTKFADQLAQIRKQHDGLRDEIEQVRQDLPERLKQKRQQLDASVRSESVRRKAMLSFKRRCEEELASLERQLNAYDRKNESLFAELTDRMFATLYHEAFHAYLENFVYPHERHDVPRWLNEGLAQIFEGGLLEAQTLRVDAPHKPALETLQASLASPEPLSLANVLTADYRSFLVPHGGGDQVSGTHYAYSWGLAWYLTFERPMLGTPALDEYVATRASERDPIRRFEELVGKPLGEFEADWRKHILALKPAK